MVRFIEYSQPILEKVRDFLFENYIYVIVFLLILGILGYRFRNRKERMMKRQMERLELEQYLQQIVNNNQYNYENNYVSNFKEYNDYPENQTFQYNPDISNIIDYTPSHPDAFNYEEEPMISYNNNDYTNQYYANNYQQQQQQMDNYFYH